MTAICPKCDKPITEIRIVQIPAKHDHRDFKGLAYTCPLCHTILSAGIDPLAIAGQTVQEIRKR